MATFDFAICGREICLASGARPSPNGAIQKFPRVLHKTRHGDPLRLEKQLALGLA